MLAFLYNTKIKYWNISKQRIEFKKLKIKFLPESVGQNHGCVYHMGAHDTRQSPAPELRFGFLRRGHSLFKLKRTFREAFLTLQGLKKNFNEPSSKTKSL